MEINWQTTSNLSRNKASRKVHLWTLVAAAFDNQPRLQPPCGLHRWPRKGGQQLQRLFCGAASLKTRQRYSDGSVDSL